MKMTTKTTPKSTGELRTFLLNQMSKVADGSQDAQSAKAICNYAQQIYNTVNLELKYAKVKSSIGDTTIESVSFLGK